MEHDRLVNVDELAAYLNVSAKTLYAWRYRKKGPPALRVGRHLRYRWADINEWVTDQLESSNGPLR